MRTREKIAFAMLENEKRAEILNKEIERLEDEFERLSNEMQVVIEQELEEYKIKKNQRYNEEDFEDVNFMDIVIKGIKEIEIGDIFVYNVGGLNGFITRVNDTLYYEMYGGQKNSYQIDSLCEDAYEWDAIDSFQLIGYKN